MTALQPVWTPADFDATVAAAALHEPVRVTRHRRGADGLWWFGAGYLPAGSVRHYMHRGKHRANRFSRTVADLGGAQ